MGLFWAKFIESEGNLFRVDTRIYLKDTEGPSNKDRCIGAVVGKNPGSAKPGDSEELGTLKEINLDNDKLLPTVRNIILESKDKIQEDEYIQVLNLFYLCNSNLDEAVLELNKMKSRLVCPSEKNGFPWVWFIWGGSDKDLNPLKSRFKSIDSTKTFFYAQRLKELKKHIPKEHDKARHTQGMIHCDIIPLIKKTIKGK